MQVIINYSESVISQRRSSFERKIDSKNPHFHFFLPNRPDTQSGDHATSGSEWNAWKANQVLAVPAFFTSGFYKIQGNFIDIDFRRKVLTSRPLSRLSLVVWVNPLMKNKKNSLEWEPTNTSKRFHSPLSTNTFKPIQFWFQGQRPP